MKDLAEYILGQAVRIAGIALIAMSLVACTGIDSTFGIFQDEDENDPGSAQFPDLGTDTTAVGVAAVPPGTTVIGRVYFSPIIGAPAEKVGVLSNRLGSETGARGIVVISATDANRTHEIKGYFSAIADNGNTVVVHVWDVILPSGQRVHRIQGQETVPGTSADPWASVPDTTMSTIADRLIADFMAWRATQA
ncbi:hypothetical protein [Oricola sp.]|uniref:hypothetical protein n=1 Tax=Oricola sp. TaxID=1979950 RepID=UPI003BAB79AA